MAIFSAPVVRSLAALVCLASVCAAAGLPDDWKPPAAPGPYLRHAAKAPTLKAGQPLLATS